MNILIPILGFGKAGGYRVLSNLASEWKKLGHKVDFLVPETSPPPYFPTDAAIIASNRSGDVFKYRRESSTRGISALDNLLSLYSGVKKIGDNYDVILANQSFTPWPIWLARPQKASLFCYVQAYEPDYYQLEKKWLSWLIAKLSYKLPFFSIVNSGIYIDYKGVRSVGVVPPGLDFNIFHAKDHRKELRSADEIIVGTIGRSEPSKGTIYALEGFAKAYKQDGRLKLKVAYGNLPENWCHEDCSVIIPKNDYELADYYRSLDVLLAPCTTQQGAPHYPVMEAMACGVAVVTTGYIPADDRNSWIVANKSPSSISDAILELTHSDDYERKVTTAAKDIESYSWPIVAQSMLKLLYKYSEAER
jgi:glycosyltransferase involved in cell wall biosynthesis